MKRLTTIIGILLLSGAVAVPVMAWGPGWGRDNHMMGYRGNGPEYSRDFGNLTPEQKGKLETLDRKFYDETRDMQNHILNKSRELHAVLNGSNPDLYKAKALQKEISALRAELDEKTLSYEIEARRIVPGQRLGYAYGGGYGRHMGPSGHGMGHGPGNSWD